MAYGFMVEIVKYIVVNCFYLIHPSQQLDWAFTSKKEII